MNFPKYWPSNSDVRPYVPPDPYPTRIVMVRPLYKDLAFFLLAKASLIGPLATAMPKPTRQTDRILLKVSSHIKLILTKIFIQK